LENLTLRSEILCQMFSSWWDFEGDCAKSAHSFVLCLNLPRFQLYSVLNENSNMMISKLWGVCRTQSYDPSCGLEVIWEMSNTVILKLRGVCRTQSCDPPCGLEITWGPKMSTLLNLIAYSLACLLTCTNWFLSCICERLAKNAIPNCCFSCWDDVYLVYMLVLVEMGVLCLWWLT
jgi:hypothetical protein